MSYQTHPKHSVKYPNHMFRWEDTNFKTACLKGNSDDLSWCGKTRMWSKYFLGCGGEGGDGAGRSVSQKA